MERKNEALLYMDYVGTRWYKCDFHLHTTISKCYKEKTDSVYDWVAEVEKKGITCIAVTDHNDYRGIAPIVAEAHKKGIVVFPGVEVTCDSSKIHVLILFDVEKTEDKVRDFLSAIDIDSDLVGNTDGTTMNIFDVCEKAKKRGAMVIAAHIDEFNGINCMSAANLSKILDRKYLDAVQVVNGDIWELYKTKKDEPVVLEKLHERYGKEISADDAQKWRKTFNKAKEANIPAVTFSDNPYAPCEGEHGLWGIGERFTWIKMDQNPNLESLRQAFLSDDMRIVTDTVSKSCPEQIADYWIQYVKMNNSSVNPNKELHVDFNPQLNTIIGGRGSGKSTIIRILAGALGAANKNDLKVIENEQNDFYKKTDSKTKLGIFTSTSEIEIGLFRNSIKYRIKIFNIINASRQDIELYEITEDGEKKIEDLNFIDFFKPLVYTQKQIFEIAKDQDALLKIIDGGIEELPDAKRNKEQIYEQLLTLISEIHTIEGIISREGKVQTELEDINNQIEKFRNSGISGIIDEKQKYANDKNIADAYLDQIDGYIKQLQDNIPQIENPENYDELSDEFIKQKIEKSKSKIEQEIQKLQGCIEEIKSIKQTFIQEIKTSEWESKRTDLEEQYKKTCDELESAGLDITKLDELLKNQQAKIKEIEGINKQKKTLVKKEKEKSHLEKQYEDSFKNIRKLRKAFIDNVLGEEENVRIEIHAHKNANSFEKMIKDYTQKDGVSINNDIDKLSNQVFVKGNLQLFRDQVQAIRMGEDPKDFSAVIKKAIRDMDDKVFDKMISFVPDDEIEVQYKPKKGKTFLPLSSASAGQKTTAILTFVLAYGDKPLLLDQPEDDLDNKLVFDLVVKRLKKAKANRQLIIVTHNANIPVNGDAEYISSMNSESRFVEVKYSGTLDNENVRKEICDVMEGTEYAFEMRAKKYHLRIVE